MRQAYSRDRLIDVRRQMLDKVGSLTSDDLAAAAASTTTNASQYAADQRSAGAIFGVKFGKEWALPGVSVRFEEARAAGDEGGACRPCSRCARLGSAALVFGTTRDTRGQNATRPMEEVTSEGDRGGPHGTLGWSRLKLSEYPRPPLKISILQGAPEIATSLLPVGRSGARKNVSKCTRYIAQYIGAITR